MQVSKERSDILEEELVPPSKKPRLPSNEMSSLLDEINCYQDSDFVTASVKIYQKNLKSYRADFSETGFTVYADDALFWECKLYGAIVPKKCKLRPGSVRVEVRLKKQDVKMWDEYFKRNETKVYNPVKSLLKSDELSSMAAQPDESSSVAAYEQSPLSPSSLEDTSSQPPLVNESNTADSISDANASNSQVETTPTLSMEHEPGVEPTTITSNSIPNAPSSDPLLRTPSPECEFVDHLYLPEPVEQASSSQRNAEPRKAAGSFDIIGADATAGSGDNAIDSDDVVVPDAADDNELELPHLVHDWIDKIPNPVVEVTISVRSFNADSLRVRFSEDSFKVIFKTRAEMFLKMIPGATEDSFIYWKPKLFGKIIPRESKHWLKMPKLYIQLKKAPPLSRWKSLEAPSPSTSASQPTAIGVSPTPAPGSNVRRTVSVSRNTVPVSNNPATPAARQNSQPPASDAGKAVAVTKVGTGLKLVDTCYTGLINIETTCYMNTIIQCLSNTRELRDYLISGTFTKERNTSNPLGYNGKLVDMFASLLRKLWSGQHQKLSPHSILSLMASKYNQFTERSQHDAHEFMSFLLDGLHEDMNRVHVKPNTAAVEPNNRPDEVVAREAWQIYHMRNDSFIVDMFQGQFKSTLFCVKCSTVSVTFDPFSCLAVPLPKKMRVLSLILVRKDPSVTPMKYKLKLPHDCTLELLKASIGKRVGILMTKLRVFEAYKGRIQEEMSNNIMSINRIGDNDVIIVSEVWSEQETGEEVVEVPVLQRLTMPFHPTSCAFCKKPGTVDTLKRCTKCLAVAYCNRTCQEDDWKRFHRISCKAQNQLPPVGVPFIVSLPKSQCTYRNLADKAEQFARQSLNVERAKVQQQSEDQASSSPSGVSVIDGNITTDDSNTTTAVTTTTTTTATTTAAAVTDSANSVEGQTDQLVDGNSLEGGAMSSTIGISSPSSAGEKTTSTSITSISSGNDSLHNHIEEVPVTDKSKFFFTPVNRFGHTEGGRLEDTGDRPVDLTNVRYLALDWRNNPKQKGYVEVTEKTQFYNMDSSCSTTYTDETESGPATLEKCLHLFAEPETLSSDEAWYCPKCKKHQEAIKQMSPWYLPKILIVQLKRFTYQNCIWKDKIDKNVSFPLKGLDLSKYMAENATKDTYFTTHPPVYDLYGVVNHFGSVFFGHYTAYVQSQDGWLLYDDVTVRRCKAAEVNNQHAYLLFYRMRNC